MRGEIVVSERIYGALLHLYPKQFRAAYGRQMRLTFRDACRSAYRQEGMGGLLALWLPTLLDLVKSALEERARQGEIGMSKAKLIALAGPLMILVGLMWVMVSIGEFVLQSGLVYDDALVGFITVPFFLSFVPLFFALIGTRLRFHQSAGIPGKVGLALSVAGTAGVLVAMLANILLSRVAPEASQWPWVSILAVVCIFSIRIGYIFFGVDALRYRLLPRMNLLPLLAGLTVVLSLSFDWFGVPAFFPSLSETLYIHRLLEWATPFMHFAISGVCWVLLGIALLEPRREPRPTAAI